MTVSAETRSIVKPVSGPVPQSRITKSIGSMTLSDGRVRIKFAQPEDHAQAAQQYANSVAAERQCRAYVAANCIQEFTVEVQGELLSPGVEVSFQRSLLEKLPLLADVMGSTDSSESSEIELRCSVWGLVSLLILLEGETNVEGWFRSTDTDPALPGSTLLAADFMGCVHVKEDILKWLRNVLCNVVATQADSTAEHAEQAYQDQTQQEIQVLGSIPSDFIKDVFCAITGAQAASLHLPLFSQWVAATSEINLREVSMTVAQWDTLRAAVLQQPPDAIAELHVSASLQLVKLVAWCHGLRQAPFPYQAYCSCDKKREIARIVHGPATIYLGGVHDNWSCPYNTIHTCGSSYSFCVEDLSSPLMNSLSQDNALLLISMQAVVAHTTSLKVLGMHNIHLSDEVMPTLDSLLKMLPPTLIQLHITTHSFEPVSVQVKEKFFRAVAQVHTLQELHMPEWEAFVGTDAAICTEPLLGLPVLRIVVPEVQETEAFPAGLSFVARQ